MRGWWYGFWVRVYFLRLFGWNLRRVVNGAQRILKREPWQTRAPLPTFETPDQVEAYVAERFDWRPDETRLGGRVIPLDYVTHPEVFQARLESGAKADGDCDDVHTWAAHVLKTVPGVSEGYPMSCVWKGGGHTTTPYEFKGMWYLFNYRIYGPFERAELPDIVAQWASEKGKPPVELLFWCVETTKHKLVACSPKPWVE